MANRKVALITGASTGIGFELARPFASNGFDIMINAEHADTLESAAATLRGEGATVTTCAADLNTHDGIHMLRNAIEAAGRPLDALAANAGFGLGGRFTETDL